MRFFGLFLPILFASTIAIDRLDAAEPSWEDLVKDLSSDDFKVREEATRQLWEAGSPAMDLLRKVADGNDPEAAFRARTLVRRIELHITPHTDPEVTDLAERYVVASRGEKQRLLAQLEARRAWRQLLFFSIQEKDPEIRGIYQPAIGRWAIMAARERLIQNDAAGAREFLEIASSDPQVRLSLAAFHRSQGTLAKELEKMATATTPDQVAWRLALHRAAGNLDAARADATELGDHRTASFITALSGDPLPWMRQTALEHPNDANRALYANLAAKRWEGKKVDAHELDPFVEMLDSRDRGEQWTGIAYLSLFGRISTIESALLEKDTLAASQYFSVLERFDESFEALGIDSKNPDWPAIAAAAFDDYLNVGNQNNVATEKLIHLLSLAEQRGLSEQLVAGLSEPVLRLAEEDQESFTTLLSMLASRTGISAMDTTTRLAALWAKNDHQRWREVVLSFYGSDADTFQLWNWMGELDPSASEVVRFEGLNAISLKASTSDPNKNREYWLRLIWDEIEKKPDNERHKLLQQLLNIIPAASSRYSSSSDTATVLKIREMSPEAFRISNHQPFLPFYLSSVGRWNDLAESYLESIRSNPNSSAEQYAAAASSLRRAGRAKEAAEHDQWVEKLALADATANIRIALAYTTLGGDLTHARKWWQRAVLEGSSDGVTFTTALSPYAELLLTSGEWKEAASIFEIIALATMGPLHYSNSIYDQLIQPARYRMKSDLARALSIAPTDRPRAAEILDASHAINPTDGALADYFFPALRQAGLIREHDRLFEKTWLLLVPVAEKYPGSDNTLNLLGWFASRACRRLDEAEKFLEQALSIQPENAAYLDTMAEIWFARGNRTEAVKWVGKSLNYQPAHPELRSQYFRFLDAPLPR